MGGWEWAILVLIALLLFGGSRLSGIGRNAGRAVREFKEETAALKTPSGGVPDDSHAKGDQYGPEAASTSEASSPASPGSVTPASAPSPTDAARD